MTFNGEILKFFLPILHQMIHYHFPPKAISIKFLLLSKLCRLLLCFLRLLFLYMKLPCCPKLNCLDPIFSVLGRTIQPRRLNDATLLIHLPPTVVQFSSSASKEHTAWHAFVHSLRLQWSSWTVKSLCQFFTGIWIPSTARPCKRNNLPVEDSLWWKMVIGVIVQTASFVFQREFSTVKVTDYQLSQCRRLFFPLQATGHWVP